MGKNPLFDGSGRRCTGLRRGVGAAGWLADWLDCACEREWGFEIRDSR